VIEQRRGEAEVHANRRPKARPSTSREPARVRSGHETAAHSAP
jgi:hypothetical protein